MKVRAIAVANERSNVVGTLELECTPGGLVMSYLGVTSYQDGYIPGVLSDGSRVTVPWSAVQEARVEGEQLYLKLSEAIGPHNKLILVNFSTGDHTHHRHLHRQRWVLRIAFAAAAVVVMLLSAILIPASSSRGAAAALVIGAVASATILVLGLAADRRIAVGGVDSDAARLAFAGELGSYLPTLSRSPRAPQKPGKAWTLPTFQGLLPRTTAAIVITLTASTLGLVLVARWVVQEGGREPKTRELAYSEREARREATLPQPTPAPVPTPQQPAAVRSPSSIADPAAKQPSASSTGDVELGGPCECPQAHSVLWESPVPRLSLLVLDTALTKSGSRPELRVEVAAINNSDEPLEDLTVDVKFFERDPGSGGRRHWTENRALYFEGPLSPGQAIKWGVEADGNEFEIENPVPGDIGPGGDGAAPLSAFAELLSANHRPVRLHGAMMLAYLGDSRARAAATELKDALRESEAPFLRRVLASLTDLRACRLTRLDEQKLRACIYNAGDKPKSSIGVRIRALEEEFNPAFPVAPPPVVTAEPKFKVPDELEPKSGVLVIFPLPPDAAQIELEVDRFDLL